MDTITRNKIINNALGKRHDKDIREKLRKLLNERQIPFLSSKDIEFRKSIAYGSFGIVDLVRYQKTLYAHKKTRYGTNEQHNNILEEAIKLTDIAEYHPNIQQVYFINLDTLGFLMDYCDCGSLDKVVINQSLTYKLVDVVNWGYQLAEALSFLHSKKIMHRDVKMQNILLKDNYQTLVLTDYGTATQLGRSLLTNDVGTPITMAPEVFSGTSYTEQCDIYSWAIVFWQLISKQFSPYENQNMNRYNIMMKVVMENLRPPELKPCPELFLALIYRSCHSNSHERPPLIFIKKILRFLLHILPKDKQECSKEMVDEINNQCRNDLNSLGKYLPSKPRLNNEKSKNIYEEHIKKFKIIADIKHDISKLEEDVNEQLEQNKLKRVHHDELLAENEKLQEQINKLRP